MQNKEVEGVKIKLSEDWTVLKLPEENGLARANSASDFRANIDYGEGTAFCTYGTIGIKVWVYKGEVHI